MTQPTLFDLDRETKARDRGMAVAAAKNGRILALARAVADQVAIRGDLTADIDRVREFMDTHNIKYEAGPWMGSVFKKDRWEPTGHWVQSRHKGGHGRAIRVWRLVGM